MKKEIEPDKPAIGGVAVRGKDGFTFGQKEPVEAYYLSGGCVLYKREFCQKMWDLYPELSYTENLTKKERRALYMPYIHEGEYLSEDWAYCQRALDKGFKMYLRPDVLCDHWGLRNYTFAELLEEKSNG
jgi:hypothetical protein